VLLDPKFVEDLYQHQWLTRSSSGVLTAKRLTPEELEEYRIEGETTIPLHLRRLDDEAFRSGEYSTGFLEGLLSRVE
jgi:hypothetical protein